MSDHGNASELIVTAVDALFKAYPLLDPQWQYLCQALLLLTISRVFGIPWSSLREIIASLIKRD